MDGILLFQIVVWGTCGTGLQYSNISGEWVKTSTNVQFCLNYINVGLSKQETSGKVLEMFCSFISVVENDLRWTNPWMAPQKQPASLRVWVSKSVGQATTQDLKQGTHSLKLQLSTLTVAPCVKGLTYISRMLQPLSLSVERINPHEEERHIQALVTGWHSAADWTPCPWPPHYIRMP